MRSVVLVVGLLATGCRGLFGLENATALDGDAPIAPLDDAPPADATDAPVTADAPDPKCFGTLFQVCLQDLPLLPFTLNNSIQFDTGGNAGCATTTNAAAAGYCVFAATSYTLSSGVNLNLFGPKPIVILATTGDITIAGNFDAASEVVNPTFPAPASNPAVGCDPGTNRVGAGGGQGGSFGSKGGNGGPSNAGGAGGVAGDTTVPIGLRGGCPGGAGDVANGGRGGGAAVLISTTKVRVTGVVNASGAGGGGGPADNHGGGGGGSGGMIVIDAPVIETPGQVWANGGGGGGGSNTQNAQPGEEPTNASSAGQGGQSGGAGGGKGGNGSSGASGQPGDNGGGTNGGGGGGGGAGVIRYKVAATGGQTSPAPIIGP